MESGFHGCSFLRGLRQSLDGVNERRDGFRQMLGDREQPLGGQLGDAPLVERGERCQLRVGFELLTKAWSSVSRSVSAAVM